MLRLWALVKWSQAFFLHADSNTFTIAPPERWRKLIYMSDIQLSSSVQAGPKWLFRSDFPSCSESAEIWHVYSFCVKKCPWFFFKNAETYGQNCVKFNPPLFVSKQRRISIFEGENTVHVSFYAFLWERLLSPFWGREIEATHYSLFICNVEFRSLRAKTLYMCLLRYWRGGELSRMCLKPCFPACGKKTGTFFNTKRVDMPNFSWFGATWKIATK